MISNHWLSKIQEQNTQMQETQAQNGQIKDQISYVKSRIQALRVERETLDDRMKSQAAQILDMECFVLVFLIANDLIS